MISIPGYARIFYRLRYEQLSCNSYSIVILRNQLFFQNINTLGFENWMKLYIFKRRWYHMIAENDFVQEIGRLKGDQESLLNTLLSAYCIPSTRVFFMTFRIKLV